MRTILALASLLLIVAPMESTYAKTSKAASKNAPAGLGTSFRFSPNALNGKYQSAPSSSVVVEGDKYLDDLLAPRKNFADRNQQDLERN